MTFHSYLRQNPISFFFKRPRQKPTCRPFHDFVTSCLRTFITRPLPGQPGPSDIPSTLTLSLSFLSSPNPHTPSHPPPPIPIPSATPTRCPPARSYHPLQPRYSCQTPHHNCASVPVPVEALPTSIPRRVAETADPLEAAAKDHAGAGDDTQFLGDEDSVFGVAVGADADVGCVGAHFLSHTVVLCFDICVLFFLDS